MNYLTEIKKLANLDIDVNLDNVERIEILVSFDLKGEMEWILQIWETNYSAPDIYYLQGKEEAEEVISILKNSSY